jgi:hypothetical protein
VDEPPVAEVLPGLYRAVLDAVADLEAINRRPAATAIRSEAIRVYSRAWTPDAARRLRSLRIRADRIAEVRGRTRYEPNAKPASPPSDLERRTA